MPVSAKINFRCEVKSVDVVILAAGKGTRMKGDEPKVLHDVCGRPMLEYVINTAKAITEMPPIVVVGYAREKIQQAFEGMEVRWVVQEEQKGTGHAVLVCMTELEKNNGPVVIINADQPIIPVERLASHPNRVRIHLDLKEDHR